MPMIAVATGCILSESDVKAIEKVVKESSFDQTIRQMFRDLLQNNNAGVDLHNYPTRSYAVWYMVNNFLKREGLSFELRPVKPFGSVHRLFVVEWKEVPARKGAIG